MRSSAGVGWSDTTLARLATGAAVAYLLATTWAMQYTSYDVWGALIVAPVIGLLLTMVVRRTFTGSLLELRRAAYVGIAAKLVGTLARYWVAFDAYGGLSDSTEYHRVGRIIAGEFHRGELSVLQMLPHTTGTRSVGEITGLLYAAVGSSRLAGFMWFAALGFTGVVLMVKAACISIPQLARQRYAWLCFLMPSVVFWPSSIGKEAVMSLFLGAISLGAARLFKGGSLSVALAWIVAGSLGAALVRPHLAAIWLGALLVALLWTVVSGRVTSLRGDRRIVLAVLAGAGMVGLSLVAKATIDLLSSSGEETDSLSTSVGDIFQLTADRSNGGGSRLDLVTVTGPLDYPLAIVRTLTRPLLPEATNLATLLPALEMTFLVGLALVSWRRWCSLPGLLRRSSFVLLCGVQCVMVGIAFSNFANLAILVRQRSLVIPSMLVLFCLPAWRPKGRGQPAAARPLVAQR